MSSWAFWWRDIRFLGIWLSHMLSKLFLLFHDVFESICLTLEHRDQIMHLGVGQLRNCWSRRLLLHLKLFYGVLLNHRSTHEMPILRQLERWVEGWICYLSSHLVRFFIPKFGSNTLGYWSALLNSVNVWETLSIQITEASLHVEIESTLTFMLVKVWNFAERNSIFTLLSLHGLLSDLAVGMENLFGKLK